MVTKVVSPASTSVRTVVPRPLRSKRRSSMCGLSESERDLSTYDPRVVDESGEVLEVDTADVADLIGAVAAEGRHLVLAVGPRVADAGAELEQRRTGELQLLVEEEVHLAPVGDVTEEIQLTVRPHGDAIAQREVARPLGGLRQRVAVDQRKAIGVERVQLGARLFAGELPVEAGTDREGRILDARVVVAAGQVQLQVVDGASMQFQLGALADRVLGVDQLDLVGYAADRSELLMADVVVVDVERKREAPVGRLGLDAELVRDVVLGPCHLDGERRWTGGRLAKARRAEARRDAGVEIRI